MGAAPVEAPDRVEAPTGQENAEHDRVWNVIVWNDPVTLMSYVVYVLRKLFGHDEATATKLMMQIHTEGRAAVTSGSKEQAEARTFAYRDPDAFAAIMGAIERMTIDCVVQPPAQ
jgi:ATP-dependent Clp protease adaptor protein ClpS